ncbi:MAG: type IV pilus modification protein PilV [Nitrococcus sp.]|nr:type IV pilus modification protein PilV [Nitrococcus sp.]
MTTTTTPTQIARPFTASGRSGGFTLVEVLIALLVLSVGLLGIAGLQLTSLRSNHSAYLRSQATLMAYDILDRMRANRAQAQSDGYDITIDDVTDLPSVKGTPTQAAQDLNAWGANVLALLPAAVATVNENNDIVNISIQWDDSRADRADDRSGTAVTDSTQFQFQTEF